MEINICCTSKPCREKDITRDNAFSHCGETHMRVYNKNKKADPERAIDCDIAGFF